MQNLMTELQKLQSRYTKLSNEWEKIGYWIIERELLDEIVKKLTEKKIQALLGVFFSLNSQRKIDLTFEPTFEYIAGSRARNFFEQSKTQEFRHNIDCRVYVHLNTQATTIAN